MGLTNVATGATSSFTTVGATHLGSDGTKSVVLKRNLNNATTYDLSGIKIRIHDLG